MERNISTAAAQPTPAEKKSEARSAGDTSGHSRKPAVSTCTARSQKRREKDTNQKHDPTTNPAWYNPRPRHAKKGSAASRRRVNSTSTSISSCCSRSRKKEQVRAKTDFDRQTLIQLQRVRRSCRQETSRLQPEEVRQVPSQVHRKMFRGGTRSGQHVRILNHFDRLADCGKPSNPARSPLMECYQPSSTRTAPRSQQKGITKHPPPPGQANLGRCSIIPRSPQTQQAQQTQPAQPSQPAQPDQLQPINATQRPPALDFHSEDSRESPKKYKSIRKAKLPRQKKESESRSNLERYSA